MIVKNLIIAKSKTSIVICKPYEKKTYSKEFINNGQMSGIDCIKKFGNYEVTWHKQTFSDNKEVSVLEMVITKPQENTTIC